MRQNNGFRVNEQALAEQTKRTKRARAAEKRRKKARDPGDKKPISAASRLRFRQGRRIEQLGDF